jgi:hypothetical protein
MPTPLPFPFWSTQRQAVVAGHVATPWLRPALPSVTVRIATNERQPGKYTARLHIIPASGKLISSENPYYKSSHINSFDSPRRLAPAHASGLWGSPAPPRPYPDLHQRPGYPSPTRQIHSDTMRPEKNIIPNEVHPTCLPTIKAFRKLACPALPI